MKTPFGRKATAVPHTLARPSGPIALPRRVAAWCVHLLTASGAVVGLLALLAIDEARWMDAFAWMGLTVLIDGVDGLIARAVGVRRVVPMIDGALLDNIVDYFTYVLVPAYFVCKSGLLYDEWRIPAAAAMILSSAYQFCQVDAKTAEHDFTGWPSYWNIALFYLVVLDPDPTLNLIVILGCAVLVFVPVRYLYPSRTERFRIANLLLVFAWAAALVIMWMQYPAVHIAITVLSLSYVVYYHVVSLYATFRHP